VEVGLVGAPTHFAVIFKHIFKQKFRPKHAKNALFFWGGKLEKLLQNRKPCPKIRSG